MSQSESSASESAGHAKSAHSDADETHKARDDVAQHEEATRDANSKANSDTSFIQKHLSEGARLREDLQKVLAATDGLIEKMNAELQASDKDVSQVRDEILPQCTDSLGQLRDLLKEADNVVRESQTRAESIARMAGQAASLARQAEREAQRACHASEQAQRCRAAAASGLQSRFGGYSF